MFSIRLLRWKLSVVIIALIATTTPTRELPAQTAEDEFTKARHAMVENAIVTAGVENQRVLKSMRDTPRHEFVATKYRSQAYFDMALPIGDQQTISSPFIVSYMTEALDPQPTDKVLEIGTGSGYQAAILSPLVKEVYSIEIVPSLGRSAARVLRRLNYDNVTTKIGDGFLGWPEYAPFDKVIVTCSPEDIPKPLVDQLREGGLMVIPVGERYQQTLYLMRKTNGKLVAEALRPTLFVPMTGAAEQNRDIKPDPANPQAINGDFEHVDPDGAEGFVPGWYYQRQLEWIESSDAPSGKRFVQFANKEAGRSAHLLQGLAIDGREVREIKLSAYMMCEEVWPGPGNEESPRVVITFFDDHRRTLGHAWLGPIRGDQSWQPFERTIRVPVQAREGILRIGLFGATGRAAFDDVKIEVIKQ